MTHTTHPSGGRSRRVIITVLAIVASGAGLATILIVLPTYMVEYDLSNEPISATDRVGAIHEARTAVLQALGGVAIAVGAYATWRRLRINVEELRATRDGQATERFTRAIDQLGSASIDVRIGAVFGLARIAENSPTDRDAIITTLSAFARGHSPWPPRLPEQPAWDADLTDFPTLAARAGDVQAAVAVLGRLPTSANGAWIRLPGTDLRRARMWRLCFDHALFGSSCLRGARLWSSSAVGADFGVTDLRDADLTDANLTSALLWGANLAGADLTRTTLEGAQADDETIWPDGFDPSAHGVRMTPRHARVRHRTKLWEGSTQ